MVFLPLSDDDPDGHTPVAAGLIVVTILVFLWQQFSGPPVDATFTGVWGVVPFVARGDVPEVDAFHRFAPFVSYMFLHAGWLHLLGNMLFLWIFGDNVEAATSSVRFLALYLASGIAGAIVYVAFATQGFNPLVGASGAIAGVMGAYLMIRPCAIVRVLMFVVVVRIRALYVVGGWMALQLVNALMSSDSEVAWWAHVGGALAGATLILVLRAPGVKLFACRPVVTNVGGAGPWSR